MIEGKFFEELERIRKWPNYAPVFVSPNVIDALKEIVQEAKKEIIADGCRAWTLDEDYDISKGYPKTACEDCLFTSDCPILKWFGTLGDSFR